MNTSSPSFCALLWNHLVLKKAEAVLPCCTYTGSGVLLSPEQKATDALQSSYFQDLRKQADRGEMISGCQRCYDSEKACGESNRTNANRDFQEFLSTEAKLRSVEFSLGNLCNLKCQGCGPSSSSRWATTKGTELHVQSSSLLDGHWADLRYIKILGGEPFLNPEHEVLIQNLLRFGVPKETTLLYASNGTFPVSTDILEAWKQFKKVEIGFSIDGIREKNDEFRVGSRWQEVIANIHWFRQNTKDVSVDWFIHSVINIYNVHEIDLLDDWLLSEFPDFWLTKDCLIEPMALNIRGLPLAERVSLIQKYQNLAEDPKCSRKRRKGYQKIAYFLK